MLRACMLVARGRRSKGEKVKIIMWVGKKARATKAAKRKRIVVIVLIQQRGLSH